MSGVILPHQKPPPPRGPVPRGGFFWEGADVAQPQAGALGRSRSSWVGPHPKAQKGGNVPLPNHFPLLFPGEPEHPLLTALGST